MPATEEISKVGTRPVLSRTGHSATTSSQLQTNVNGQDGQLHCMYEPTSTPGDSLIQTYKCYRFRNSPDGSVRAKYSRMLPDVIHFICIIMFVTLRIKTLSKSSTLRGPRSNGSGVHDAHTDVRV